MQCSAKSAQNSVICYMSFIFTVIQIERDIYVLNLWGRGRRKQHKINVVTTPAYLTPTFIVKQHGPNLSNLHFPMSIDLQAANLRSNKRKCLPSFKIATFNCRTLRSDHGVLELIELVRKKCIDVLAILEHRRTKTALVTDINIPTGYRLFMNDTH